MIFWIIVGLFITFYVGFLTCAFFKSGKVAELYSIIEYLKSQLIEKDNKIKELENKINSYPTYSKKV
jgi:hypothetical protein